MKRLPPTWSLTTLLLILICQTPTCLAQIPTYKRAAIATVQPVATDAGLAAFNEGGNAVDAAIAAALMLGVADGHNSGIGGGCFILINTADGELIAIDGREMAPAAATRDMFLRDGNVVPELSTTGPLAVAVPGALAAYEVAATKYGKLGGLNAALERAAKVADAGFVVDRVYARNLLTSQPDLLRFAGSRQLLLNPNGDAPKEGDSLKLPDLAKTYRKIASKGTDWFYRGPLAASIGKWMTENGGVLRESDFANYQTKARAPIRTTYRGYEIVGFPPPSSGGIHVAQVLNILEHFDLRVLLKQNPALAHHIIAEAMRLAFADRAHWLGDADFAKVPRGLVDQTYAKSLAAQINRDHVTKVPAHGLPPEWETSVYGKHTTHIATADAEGNWVAITQTVNTSFGSKVVVPGTGVVLNNEMDDFSAKPGAPNAFGLVGAEANAVAPGKRPLSSMSPTIVLKDGKPVLTVGAAGGPKIITQVILAIIRFVDADLPIQQCVSQPRIHHQWKPNRLFVESDVKENWLKAFKSKGHEIEVLEFGGVSQAIARPNGKRFTSVADPRVPGKASGL